MIVSSYHPLVGPLVTAGALAVILLLCRWVFAPPKRVTRRQASASTGDYGLLVPVATVRTSDDAQMLRSLLQDAGIRCTLAGPQVLVFPADAGRARELVSS